MYVLLIIKLIIIMINTVGLRARVRRHDEEPSLRPLRGDPNIYIYIYIHICAYIYIYIYIYINTLYIIVQAV